jgi:hypothetical protein
MQPRLPVRGDQVTAENMLLDQEPDELLSLSLEDDLPWESTLARRAPLRHRVRSNSPAVSAAGMLDRWIVGLTAAVGMALISGPAFSSPVSNEDARGVTFDLSSVGK